MRYLSIFFLVFIVSASESKAQLPGLKPLKQDPNFFKVELKMKTPDLILSEQGKVNNNLYDRNKTVQDFLSARGRIYRANLDGMSCLVVNPQLIDPKSMLIIRTVPYMPNAYK